MGCTVSTKPDLYSQNGDADPYKKKKVAPVDSRLPLTARQKFQITKSWKGIARNMENTGKSMFMRLFQSNIELKNMFTGFEEFDDLEDMRESQQLENHASLVMYTIDEAIASIDDIDFVVELLGKIGRTHTRTDFNPQLFWRIEQPFLSAVKETLEDRYTKNIEEIYKITFRFIVDALIDGVVAGVNERKAEAEAEAEAKAEAEDEQDNEMMKKTMHNGDKEDNCIESSKQKDITVIASTKQR
ncbi:neuroglobin-like [Saccoglossus kowalevskii]|uniref:Cytoglobin-1-like n=1 Tax=Saccoglossus kowalevskii TaxID=10224 RepID=A0ABM0MQ48_SACKO|nr:PREDICTED: cytoglobin-1-like [Saccoglossus kowalevskii]